MGPAPLSLKAFGLRLLAQREHSVAELRRKLLRRARAAGADSPPVLDTVEEALAWLLANGHLSEQRFAESRVHARWARFGNLRIRNELAQHGVELTVQAQAELAASELARARAVWQRKYPTAPADAHESARQARFLAGRGFSSDVIRQLMRGGRAEGVTADDSIA